MTARRITVDVGEARSVVFVVDTDASPVAVLELAQRVGYLVIPAGARRQQDAEDIGMDEESYFPCSRIVAIS